MSIVQRTVKRLPFISLTGLAFGILAIGVVSCTRPAWRDESPLSRATPGWPKGVAPWREANYGVLKVDMAPVKGAEMVNDDELCLTCHEAYGKSFVAKNVHRAQKCEGCHGPASRHIETRGKEAGLILSFKTLPPAERSELCLKCHEQPHEPGDRWRTSVHAHKGVTCTDCHTGHHDVPPGTPATVVAGLEKPGQAARTAVEQLAETSSPHAERVSETRVDAGRKLGTAAGREDFVGTPETAALLKLVSARSPAKLVRAQSPDQDQAAPRKYSGTSNFMNAVAPNVCYKCHDAMRDLEAIAHPHQVNGPHGLNCTTCHDTHGKIREETRKDLCLQCHKGTPTMAWHSSTHNLTGVACTDCHNPHPKSQVETFVNVEHTTIDRPKRLPMSVDEPGACFKCHPKIYGMASLPSHHPIKEGKVVCSDCHDPHGQAHGHLKEATTNMVCYKCHAEKQGPFVREHPPVTENCGICHEPHGTVANNLLRQPPTFLCLRCHAGHRKDNRNPDPTWIAEAAPVPNRKNATGGIMRAGFFTDCSQCHAQIHGSDIGSNSGRGTFLR